MEFLASLAIKALIGTSVCGSVTIVAIHQYDKTLLGFKDNTQNTSTSTQGGNNNGGTSGTGSSDVSRVTEGSEVKQDEVESLQNVVVDKGSTVQADTIQKEKLKLEGGGDVEDQAEIDLTSTTDSDVGSASDSGVQTKVEATGVEQTTVGEETNAKIEVDTSVIEEDKEVKLSESSQPKGYSQDETRSGGETHLTDNEEGKRGIDDVKKDINTVETGVLTTSVDTAQGGSSVQSGLSTENTSPSTNSPS